MACNFLAFAFVFLFFFMEETNYDRKTVSIVEAVEASPAGSISATDEEKSSGVKLQLSLLIVLLDKCTLKNPLFRRWFYGMLQSRIGFSTKSGDNCSSLAGRSCSMQGKSALNFNRFSSQKGDGLILSQFLLRIVSHLVQCHECYCIRYSRRNSVQL